MFTWKKVVLIVATMVGCTADKTNDTSNKSDTADTFDSGQTDETTTSIWSGPRITFTKEDNTDHTDPTNQDAFLLSKH